MSTSADLGLPAMQTPTRTEADVLRARLAKLTAAATRYPRCCDLWQDSLGGMHCTECAQKTFAMLRQIQDLIGVDKDCQPKRRP